MTLSLFIRSNTIIFALALLLLPPAAVARSTKLVEPGAVTIRCTLSTEKMQDAIMRGGAKRHWMVVSEQPGKTELKYAKGSKHIITVNVSYTGNSFDVTYKDSSGLKYKVDSDGTRRIHPRPVGWMKNLSVDIQTTANNLCSR